MKRHGMTLVELLVIVAIILLIIAMILPAIHKARLLSVRLHGENNLRKIVAAMQEYASNRQGSLPGITDPTGILTKSPEPQALFAYIPYVSPEIQKRNVLGPTGVPAVECYVSPADYSLLDAELITSEFDRQRYIDTHGMTSYATNMLVHTGKPRLSTAFPDGMASTIYVAEHFFVTNRGNGIITYSGGQNSWKLNPPNGFEASKSPTRYASFADVGWYDVVPVRNPVTNQSGPSIPGYTFQHQPSTNVADHKLLQSFLPCGLLVGMADGSTKCLTQNVSESVYWGLISPAGKEIINVIE